MPTRFETFVRIIRINRIKLTIFRLVSKTCKTTSHKYGRQALKKYWRKKNVRYRRVYLAKIYRRGKSMAQFHGACEISRSLKSELEGGLISLPSHGDARERKLSQYTFRGSLIQAEWWARGNVFAEQGSHNVKMKEHEATGVCQKKPTKLRNLIYKTEAFDSLHAGNAEVYITKETSRILFSLFSLSSFTYVYLFIFFFYSHFSLVNFFSHSVGNLSFRNFWPSDQIENCDQRITWEFEWDSNECGRICESILSKNESSFR